MKTIIEMTELTTWNEKHISKYVFKNEKDIQ